MNGGLRSRAVKALAIGGGLFVLVGGGAYALVGHGSGADDSRQVAVAAPSTTGPATTQRLSTTEASSTTTTVAAVSETTVATKPAAPRESDASVKELQQRLADLGYDIGDADGFAGTQTFYALMAFQKVEGLDRTGEDSSAVREALARASRPGPMVPGGASNRVEIDLDRQVLFLWKGGSLARILPVSTGSGEDYCVDGECDVAVTPTGSFRIGRKAAGLEVSRLGELWSPMYFYGGIAIHGSPSIPPYPASHGCVRIPMYAAPTLFDQVPSGTMVYVVGNGPSAGDVAPPPDEPTRPATPPPPPPDEPPTTTSVTTTPSTTTPPETTPPDTTPPSTSPPATTPAGAAPQLTAPT